MQVVKQFQMGFRYISYWMKASRKANTQQEEIRFLIDSVIKDKSYVSPYSIAEEIRGEYLTNTGKIEHRDFGTGASGNGFRQKKVSEMVRKYASTPKYGQLLYRLAKHFQPGSILELGSSLGISSAYLALGASQAKVHSVDACPNTIQLAKDSLSEIRNIEFHNAEFDNFLTSFLAENKVDFAYIDGNHTYEASMRYFQQLYQSENCPDIMIFDDIHWSEGMQRAWNEIKADPISKVSIDLFFKGIIITNPKYQKEDFIIRF